MLARDPVPEASQTLRKTLLPFLRFGDLSLFLRLRQSLPAASSGWSSHVIVKGRTVPLPRGCPIATRLWTFIQEQAPALLNTQQRRAVKKQRRKR
jgi:hypothetical protein